MSLIEILDAREERWNRKRALAKEENRCVVSLTLRMPSELRLTGDAEKALEKGREEIFPLLESAFQDVSFKGEYS
ncbi:MAG: citrate lyase holo-[Clostridia bacterium]|nr:citrate lyase holo-[acyl-carrier protein] synthase [Clostridia bacterium]